MNETFQEPRPGTVYILSLIGSMSLWATGQIPWWLTAVQVGCFASSWGLRRRPPKFFASTVSLNVAMSAIAGVTIYSRYTGHGSIVALAYLAALTQALQLLDTRPRRSDFLLIGISLMQLVLAAALTQSILLPLGVLAFIPMLIWALAEQAVRETERGAPGPERLNMRRDLIRVTTLGTLGTLAIGVPLFFGLPRTQSSLPMQSVDSPFRVTGFSHSVTLGDVGRAQQDPRVVLRVEAIQGSLPSRAHAYWRGLAFDHFDGLRWSVSNPERVVSRQPLEGTRRRSLRLRRHDIGPSAIQRITREPFDAAVLFTPDDPERIEGRFQRIERDSNGGLYLPARSRDRVHYDIWTPARTPTAELLSLDRAAPPRERRGGRRRSAQRYLQLPELDPRVSQLAADMVDGQPNDFARVLAIQQALRRDGRYTPTPPAFDSAQGSAFEAFLLGDLAGHCEYFASAMAVLARTQGIPVRLVNGYAGGTPDEDGRFIEVAQADAHAWVEVHFERTGWVRFDPTPPDRRPDRQEATSLLSWLQAAARSVDLWWFKRVVAFDSGDQAGALLGFHLQSEQWSETLTKGLQDQVDDFAETDSQKPLSLLVLFVGVVISLLCGWRLALGWRRLRPKSRALPPPYRRAQRTLARAGLQREAATSAREFAATVAMTLPEAGAQAFAKITDQYLAERFGQAEPRDLSNELDQLDASLETLRVSRSPHSTG